MVHEPAFLLEYLPGVQKSHVEAPRGENLPAAQSWHSVPVPPTSPYVPVGQSLSHAIAPASLNVPAAHAWQLFPDSYLPATQSSHSASPTEETLPGAQTEHDSELALLFFPGTQKSHFGDASAEYRPAAHEVQLTSPMPL